MCISKDLKPVDCSAGPHPHSNNYCKAVKIPPLRRGRKVEGSDSKVRLQLVDFEGRGKEGGLGRRRERRAREGRVMVGGGAGGGG